MQNHRFKDTFFSKNLSINIRGRLMDLSTPRVMGILNVTPDSFYDGGRYNDPEGMKNRIDRIVEEGADIIDVGAASSRPGATPVPVSEEIRRLSPAVETIRRIYPEMLISIDTFNPVTAETMIREYNADIINDISAGGTTYSMFDVIAKYKVPYIIMHMPGTPETMQKNIKYSDVVSEILMFLAERTYRLKALGVTDIIIDPGFGFGKTMDHNYQLLATLDTFRCLELPVLAGISRKSMVYKFLETDPEGSLNGTTALNMFALMKGANILRVHDVREATQVCRLYSRLHNK